MAQPTVNRTLLELEAERIYRAIFQERIPDIVRQRFVAASSRFNARADPRALEVYYALLSIVTDLEALEVTARYTRKLPLFLAKFHIKVYLAETIPHNQSLFVKNHASVIGAWWAFLRGGVRTVFKLGKGLWLLARKKHV